MPTVSENLFFFIGPNPVCWVGASTYFELKLQTPLPFYALEQLRQRFLHAVTTTHTPRASARTIYQMAYETEIGVAIKKSIAIPENIQLTTVCERRGYVEIDADMQAFSFLLAPAIADVRLSGVLPDNYVRLFETHLSNPYAKYRVCALAALLCVTAQYIHKDIVNATLLSFADAATTVDAATAVRGFDYTKHETLTVSETAKLKAPNNGIEVLTVVDAVTVTRALTIVKNDTVTVVETTALLRTEVIPGTSPTDFVDAIDTVVIDSQIALNSYEITKHDLAIVFDTKTLV